MGFAAGEAYDGADPARRDQEHTVTVSGFFMDRFEITRERFETYLASNVGPPSMGAGAHPRIQGSGWQSRWDADLIAPGPVTRSQTPEADAGAPDRANLPASSLTWFEAFAFCAWDGGRLPTEAEWEYAAAGGIDNRPYPWGQERSIAEELRRAPLASVGSNAPTRGRFGHDDLAGGVQEWVLDWFAEDFYREKGRTCSDCANLQQRIARVVRGGRDAFADAAETEFRAAARNYAAPGVPLPGGGARCARDAMALGGMDQR